MKWYGESENMRKPGSGDEFGVRGRYIIDCFTCVLGILDRLKSFGYI